ncbi:hypothetical protein CT0861_08953 [Colletotrichum tofieldiae]|uniref:LPXTG-domain-containing protein n=1 Tax=Colletotrichum tofieldiae TaxID=708197 RepID=A0A161VYI0_9PEZI|nr:hypothetical protein CT0861_08953 [Colletotrichum tofieldiae]
MNIDDDAAACFPPQMTSWWFQTEDQPTSVALGPTFACPELYTAAQTLLEAGGVQHVYCCPSDYTFNVAQPTKPVFPSQCLSTATPGQTLSYESLTVLSNSLTHKPASTVVSSEALTLWAVPVNGYNFPASSTSVSSPGFTITPATQTITQPASTNTEVTRGAGNESSGTPLGLTVGVSVGVVLGVLMLCGGIFLLWRRKRKTKASRSSGELEATSVQHFQPASLEGRNFELPGHPVDGRKYELYGDNIQTQPIVYELPGSREKG